MTEKRNNNNNQQQGQYQQGPYNQQQGQYQQGAYNQQQGQYQQGPYNQQQGQYQQGQYNQQQGQYQQNPYNQQMGYQMPPVKKKKKKKSRWIMFFLEVLILVILAGGLFLFSKFNKMQGIQFQDGDIIVNEQIPQEEKEVMQTYTNIALFGLDARYGQLEKDAHSDALLIASINDITKEIKLVSVYRDTYLNNTNGEYKKATEAYFYGGAQRAINMLNTNLDLDIEDFVSIDFFALIDVIDALGGIEIDVQTDEVKWINGYQEEINTLTGRAICPVYNAGTQTLNGMQALAYCRIRYVGLDYARTERQRTVLMKILEKVQQNPLKAVDLVNTMFDSVLTSLSLTEVLSLAKDVASYSLVETYGFPYEKIAMDTDSAGDAVVPINLYDNVLRLHQDLFGSDGYTPSATVQEISNTISYRTNVY